MYLRILFELKLRFAVALNLGEGFHFPVSSTPRLYALGVFSFMTYPASLILPSQLLLYTMYLPLHLHTDL